MQPSRSGDALLPQERRQARQLEPGRTMIRGSPAPALPSGAAVPTPPPAFNFLAAPETSAFPSGAPDALPPLTHPVQSASWA